ncbi:MAG: hypothetical protein QOE33_336 [Acidobacteriota bacterium]|nr:hypothetical protein [Acidobacteriota bacterium]
MSTEDRILRLENALATLAELSADHERRAADQERRSADQERRSARLEESFLTLVQLTRSHNESFGELRAAQTETEHKLAALADAQIRGEESMKELRAETNRRFSALVDAQIRTEEALARLTTRVGEIGKGEQPSQDNDMAS